MLYNGFSDKLEVRIFENRTVMGEVAAADIAYRIRKLLSEKTEINMVFAAAPSQNDTLLALMKYDIDWTRINAFHMDEYVGLDKNHPQSFGKYLYDHVFGKVNFENIYYVADYGEKYEELLEKNHIDIVVLGIGENGHIAFNDPGVADFADKKRIKKAKLDEVCRMQQVHDGCFPTLADVPEYAYTLTIPQMVSADYMFCVVPAKTKAEAFYRTVKEEISESCPATILRRHGNAILYGDSDSGRKLL